MTWWALYYGDGSRFTSEDGAPSESPPRGAVLVVQEDIETGHDRLSGDYFVHRTDVDQWFFADLTGLLDHIVMHAADIDCVRIGLYVPNTEWYEVNRIVNADIEAGRAPPKSATRRWERV